MAKAKKAGDGEATARKLLALIDVVMPKDQQKPAVAVCDLYDLVKEGGLSKETASHALERIAHGWPTATNQKAQKAHDKLLADRKLDRTAMIIDVCERWLALNEKATPSMEMVFVASSLCSNLFGAERSKEALAVHKKFTPIFEKAHKAGHIDDGTLRESWYSGQMTTMSSNGLDKEAAKLQKLYNKI